MTPHYSTFIDGLRGTMARRFNARMDEIRMHAEIAHDLCREQNVGMVTGEMVRAEFERRAAIAATTPPPRHGDDPRLAQEEHDRRVRRFKDILGERQPRHGSNDPRHADIDRRIADAKAFLAAREPHRTVGGDLTEALRVGEDRGRAQLDPAKWSTSIHEAAHGVIAERLAPGSVARIELHVGGGGLCTFATAIPNDRYAIGCAAGSEAQYLFGVEPTSRMQDHDPRADQHIFNEALRNHFGADDIDPNGHEAGYACNTAHTYVKMDRPTIAGLARLLFDTGRVDGEDIRIVMEIRDGLHDHICRDLGIPPFKQR